MSDYRIQMRPAYRKLVLIFQTCTVLMDLLDDLLEVLIARKFEEQQTMTGTLCTLQYSSCSPIIPVSGRYLRGDYVITILKTVIDANITVPCSCLPNQLWCASYAISGGYLSPMPLSSQSRPTFLYIPITLAELPRAGSKSELC